MSEHSFGEDGKWLKEHMFVWSPYSTTTNKVKLILPGWALEGYNGLTIAVRRISDKWEAVASFNNEYGRVTCSSESTIMPSAQEAVDKALANMSEWIDLLRHDFDLTVKAFSRRIDYAECEAGFYDGMPGLEDEE